MATYYISSAATNGYALGDDGNNGTSKATPWLSLDVMNGAGFTWSGNDTFLLNGAEIGCSGELIIDNTCTIRGDVDTPTIKCRTAGAGAYGMRGTAGKTITLSNLKIDQNLCTTAPLYFSTTATMTWVISDVEFIFVSYGIFCVNAAIVTATLTRCTFTAAALTNAAFYGAQLAPDCDITFTNCVLDLAGTAITAGRGGIVGTATGAGVSFTVNGLTGSITTTQEGVGYTYAVVLSDIDGAEISNCDVTINAKNGGSNAACLYKITSGTVSVTDGSIHDNRGFCNCETGIMIVAGEDGTANNADNILVYGNDVRGPEDYGTLHGILVGGNSGCEVYNNRVRYALIGLLAKNCSDTVFAHNVIEKIKASTGMAMRFKGATDTRFVANLHIVDGAWCGMTFYITDNDGLPNSTGIVAGNARYDYPGATAAAEIVNMAASQTVDFIGNVYYPNDGFVDSQFNDEATPRTLAEWNAQSHVYGDATFRFMPRMRSKVNHRLLAVTSQVW